MLSWRRDKVGEKRPVDPSEKAKPSTQRDEIPERKSRPVSGSEPKNNAAEATGPDNRRRLGEMLVGEGIITQEQLDEALRKKEKNGGFVGQVLVELGHIKQNELISFLVKQCKIPHISLADYHISDELLSLVSEEVCVQHSLLPIDKLGKILTVAMVDPLDADALEAVRQVCPDLRIKPILCDWNHFAPACERLFKKGKGSAVTASSFGLSEQAPAESEEEPADSAEEAEQTEQEPAAEPVPTDSQAAPESDKQSSRKPVEDTEKAEIEVAVEPPARPGARPAPAAPAPAPGASAEEIAEKLRDSMRDALGDVVASIEKKTQSAPAAPAPDYAAMSELMRESVEQGMAKSTESLLKGMQASLAQAALAKSSDGDSGASMVHIAEALRANIDETMQKTVGELTKSLQAANPKIEIPAMPTADELAKAMGHSMQEAMGALAQQFSAAMEHETKRADDTQQILLAFQEALAGSKNSDNAQTERIIEVAEAARRAAETAEKAIIAMQEAQAAAAESAQQDNVHEFPASAARKIAEPDLNALDALDSPGLAARTNEQVRAALENEHPIPGYTFADFIGGKTNELTVTLCKALAAGQVNDLTPFYLFGGVGLGKSHLLNAIGNTVVAKNPDLRIGYVSAGMMARKLNKAFAEEHTAAFRERYCDMDMLLIDDIHLLAQKASAQEEMLYILDAFLHEERPILLAGNASPEKLSGLDPCLASRLFSGVVSCVRVPEQTARIEILTRMAQYAQADVPEDIVRLIAMQIQDDIRKMTGALRKVIAYARVSGHAIDKDLAGEVLSQLGVDAA